MPNKASRLMRLKRLVRERLTAKREVLALDRRIDEAPEDKIVAMALSGERALVVRAVDDLIIDFFRNADLYGVATSALFLRRALRIADVVSDRRFKGGLKLILLEDDDSVWGNALDDLKTLAARAMLELPKDATDLRFWQDVAEQAGAALPYALNAAIDIDLAKGLRLYWTMCDRLGFDPQSPLVDWDAILEQAEDLYGTNVVTRELELAFYTVIGKKDPYQYEVALVGRLGLRRFSRIRQRTITETKLTYEIPSAGGSNLFSLQRTASNMIEELTHSMIVGGPGTRTGRAIDISDGIVSPPDQDRPWFPPVWPEATPDKGALN